jgi:predicted CXXCH cytochrome family protein
MKAKAVRTGWPVLVVTAVVAVIALALLLTGVVGAGEAGYSDAILTDAAAQPVYAQGEGDEPTNPDPDMACRLCHDDSTEAIDFPSGETLPVGVDLEVLAGSAHGTHAGAALSCTECHQPADYQFPHESSEAEDLRSYEVAKAATCERCHQQPHFTGHAGAESDAPVVCTDCHGSHDVLTVEEWRSGEGTAACIECHTEAGVERTDPLQLSQIVSDGLFGQRVDADYCLACHSQPDQQLTFENGDVVSITIDGDTLHDSVHGADNPWQPLDCTDCHDRYTYPHESPPLTGKREYNLERYTLCIDCHEKNYENSLDSVHGAALEEGEVEAAVCTDCHGAHDTPTPNEPRERISHTCEQCHSEIFDTYSGSVHGESLLVDSNLDVPTCINCHGVHNISDPTTIQARLNSPDLCADCHADQELMDRYDISTEVFDTYVADFHGSTVTLFAHQDPNLETNKAVCFDCHGVHDIRSPDDPESGIKVNLLETCRQCHPDASENFPDAWTSHYEPSVENNTLVYLVNQFYRILVPATLGFFGFLVVTDIYRMVRTRSKK